MTNKIIEDKNNELLKRREIKIIVESEKNPSMQEAIDMISKQFKAQGESIVVKSIKGKFGRNTFLISAFVYQNKETKEQTEPRVKGKKKTEQKVEGKKPEEPKKE